MDPVQSVVSVQRAFKRIGENEIYSLIFQAIKDVDGWGEKLRRDNRVLLKPNFAFPYPSNTGITTDPRLIAAVIRFLRENGMKKIMVGESSMHGIDTEKAYQVTGLRRIAERLGAKVVDLKKTPVKELKIAHGQILRKVQVFAPVLETDLIINLPKLKTHLSTSITGSLKNLKGFLPDSEKLRFHKIGLNRAIADLNKTIPTNFTIVDGIVALEGLGPGIGGEAVELNLIIAGQDPVAVDSICARLYGYEPEDVPHIVAAGEHGLGNSNLNRIVIKGCPLNKILERSLKSYPKTTDALASPPNLKIIDGNPCCSCIGVIAASINRLEASGDLAKIEEAKLFTGLGYQSGERPLRKRKGERIVLVGDCLRKYQNRGFFVPGCPPRSKLLASTIRKADLKNKPSRKR